MQRTSKLFQKVIQNSNQHFYIFIKTNKCSLISIKEYFITPFIFFLHFQIQL